MTCPPTTGGMNVIAGVIGGVVGAFLTLTVRLVITHPLACTAALVAFIALAKGVPCLVVIVALVSVSVLNAVTRGD